MVSLKRTWLRSVATKKLPALLNSRGAKKVFQFGVKQLKHPAVGNYLKDVASMAIASGGNPEVAGPMIAARTAQEGAAIIGRTARHYASPMVGQPAANFMGDMAQRAAQQRMNGKY